MLKRKKRILLLMREYVLGGAETQFRYLVEYAESHKWKLDVLIEHDLNKEDDILKKYLRSFRSIRFYEMNGGRDCGKLYYSIMLHVLREIVHTKYNVCLIYYPPDLTIALFMRILGTRVVYSERVDATDIAINEYYQKCLKLCDCILANSKYAKEKLERLTGRKVGLIRNGKPVVTQLPIKKEREICRMLVPARIVPPKNQMLLLYYLKEYPDFTGKLIFAGLEEDKTYWNKLKQFVRRNNLWSQVEFLGHVDNLEKEYEKADLIVLPSIAEGTPNVVLEAYAYGRPVIVSDVGEERNLVKNPRLRFGVKNPEEIDSCIKYVEGLSDNLYRELIERNRKIVIENYSIEKMCNSFYKVLSRW
jgi:glycosyltransferase involved in cell wall biosynthesis